MKLPENLLKAYVSLGSNSTNAREMLERAVSGINEIKEVFVTAKSSVYSTEPQGYKFQPWFTNQVLELAAASYYDAQGLLAELLKLEKRLGRKRDPALRFGPRVVDIDLLWFNAEKSDNENCVLPHPAMTGRAFVLLPLKELAPQLPINGKTPDEWLQSFAWRLEGGKIFQ